MPFILFPLKATNMKKRGLSGLRLTPETVQGMTMREIRDLIDNLSSDNTEENPLRETTPGKRHYGYGGGHGGGHGNGKRKQKGSEQ